MLDRRNYYKIRNVKDMPRIGELYDNFQGLSGKQVTVNGWVRSIRNGKQNSFATLNDGSSMHDLHLFFTKSFPQKREIEHLKTGSALELRGFLQPTPNREQPFEMVVEKILNIFPTNGDYPIQKKNLPLEFIRNYQQFRGRTKYFLASFRLRSAVSYFIHEFFRHEGFIYIATPLITSNDTEGGGESFCLAQATEPGSFFHAKANLTVSGQLQAEALAQGLGRVYNFSPCFRAENSNTSRHLAEFWMIEGEVSFYELNQLIELIESMIKYIVRKILQSNSEELQFFGELKGSAVTSKLRSLLDRKFEVVSYTTCIEILRRKSSEEPHFFSTGEISWGIDFSSEQEKYLTIYFDGPVFITDYPSRLKAFYMKENHDRKTVACVDLLFPFVGEVAGGSSREENYKKLVQRAKSQKLDMEKLGWYFSLRRSGYSPSAGFGLGLERLLMFITGSENIRDTIPFPRAAGELQF